ncbi:hypothetical protein ACOSQ4_021076 [Xanthoceras sorbifolium]
MNADEIASRCASLSLQTDAMEPRIVLETPLKVAGERKLALCLVGKILTTKLINREAFRAIIPKIWRTTQTFIIENVKENVFVFQFQNQVDKRRVLMGGPWSFDKCLIVLEEPLGDCKFLEMGFTTVQFWIQLHNVPLVCMTKEIGWALGNKLGRVLDIDAGATGDCLGRFLRVRVTIDVTKPLNRFLRVCLSEGDPDTVLLLRYERLTEFCFQCGVVGHVVRECQLANDIGGSRAVPTYKFGDWLRAESPPKARYSRTMNDSSPEPHKQLHGSTVLHSPGIEALDTRDVSAHFEQPHAKTIVSSQPTSLTLASGSVVPSHKPLAHISTSLTVLAGGGLLRDGLGSTKNSALPGPAMAFRMVSGHARTAGMVGGVRGMVQREEAETRALSEAGAREALGLGAAGFVVHSEGHVHVGSVADGSAAHVHGGLPHANSGLALAQVQVGHDGTSLEHDGASLDGHGSAAHVLSKLAVFKDNSSAAHVLPCKTLEHAYLVLEHAHPVKSKGQPVEGAAPSFIFSAIDGASKTGIHSPSTANMEVDRKHFKWKRVTRKGMVGSDEVIQMPCLGKRVELEPLEGEDHGDRVKRSSGSDNGETSLLKLVGPGAVLPACQEL